MEFQNFYIFVLQQVFNEYLSFPAFHIIGTNNSLHERHIYRFKFFVRQCHPG